VGEQVDDPCTLGPVLALYDTMNDDDDEVREVGAQAARSLIGQNLVPIEAANQLLDWARGQYGDKGSFKSLVACRMVGHQADPTLAQGEMLTWASASSLLESAMEFDNSLFAVEKANLFIDEVREATRWRRVFESLEYEPEEAWFKALRSWTADGLRTIVKAAGTDDGPLGWSSSADVYALCARIIDCGQALKASGHCPEMGELLGQLVVAGARLRLHGLLFELAQRSERPKDSTDGDDEF
jgi:hypothetical protein